MGQSRGAPLPSGSQRRPWEKSCTLKSGRVDAKPSQGGWREGKARLPQAAAAALGGLEGRPRTYSNDGREQRRDAAEGWAGTLPGLLSCRTAPGPCPVGSQDPLGAVIRAVMRAVCVLNTVLWEMD